MFSILNGQTISQNFFSNSVKCINIKKMVECVLLGRKRTQQCLKGYLVFFPDQCPNWHSEALHIQSLFSSSTPFVTFILSSEVSDLNEENRNAEWKKVNEKHYKHLLTNIYFAFASYLNVLSWPLQYFSFCVRCFQTAAILHKITMQLHAPRG